MSQQENRVYYNLLSRVGNNGAYQTVALWIILGIVTIGASSFYVNTFLFYQNPYICNGVQSTHCTQHVCSLPAAQRVQYQSSQLLYTLGNYQPYYFCQGTALVTYMQESILVGGSVGVVAVVIFSDIIGRKLTILYSMIIAFIGILITHLVPIIQLRSIGLFMWGVGADISFAVGAATITEIVSEQNRAKSYVMFMVAFSTGIISNAILYYFLYNYITVGYCYYALGYFLLIILFYKYVQSPPIEIISKNDNPNESYQAFMRIAKMNKVQNHGITPEQIFTIHQNYRKNQEEKNHSMYFTFIDIFKYGSLRGDFLKISFVFFILLFLQYAPIFLMQRLVPNIFIAGIANGLSQYASIPFLPYLNTNISRRPGLMVMFALTVLFILLQYMEDPNQCITCLKGISLTLLMIFFFISRFLISLITSFNFNILNQSFPAQVRAICYCGAVGVARMSTIFIPLIPQFQQVTNIPYNVMFAIATTMGLIGCYFLRQTINIPPPEIIEELRVEQVQQNGKKITQN